MDHRIFGAPMRSWRSQMPTGMFLKSEGFASNLADPDQAWTLRRFCRQEGYPYREYGWPIPLQVFSDYGLSFQRRFAPDLEDRTVVGLERRHGGFTLRFVDGGSTCCRKVVVCSGIDHFRQTAAPLAGLPPRAASHTADHHDYTRFANMDVCVVGGGASATDAAAALDEAGARVHLVARQPYLLWTSPRGGRPVCEWWHMRNMLGAGRLGQGHFYSDAPMLFRQLPTPIRTRIVRNFLGPRGGWTVRHRVERLPKHLGFDLAGAEITAAGRVRLSLAGLNGAGGAATTIEVDHVVAGTGYRVDLRRIEFLTEDVGAGIALCNGAPRLSGHFECSVPGLYFAGVSAANAFGPLMRFVAGARFASRRISSHLAGAIG
jgi:hypothetical protein